jgi:hypothetical protein
MMGKTAYEKTLKYKNYVLTGINKEDKNTPDHPPKMPPFIRYSIISLDNPNSTFVFVE